MYRTCCDCANGPTCVALARNMYPCLTISPVVQPAEQHSRSLSLAIPVHLCLGNALPEPRLFQTGAALEAQRNSCAAYAASGGRPPPHLISWPCVHARALISHGCQHTPCSRGECSSPRSCVATHGTAGGAVAGLPQEILPTRCIMPGNSSGTTDSLWTVFRHVAAGGGEDCTEI